MEGVDYAHTPAAERRRRAKARRVAAHAWRYAMTVEAVAALDPSQLRALARAAGVTRPSAPESPTWDLVLEKLARMWAHADDPRAPAHDLERVHTVWNPPPPEPAPEVVEPAPEPEPVLQAAALVSDNPPTVPCRYCGKPGHPYIYGRYCDDCKHWPDSPKPPPGTTWADMRAARGMAGTLPRETLIDQRAIASGKRRSSSRVYRNARAAVTGAPL